MTDPTAAPAGAGATAPSEYTPHDLGNLFAEARQAKPEEQAAESAVEATAAPELAEEANAESPKPETVSEDQADEPATPAIDPPKSWTKDLHEHWASLDPVLQERIVARDREDQTAIKRAFNEAADDRKAAKAEREAAEKAKQQYEAQLPSVMQALQDAQQHSFADIKTMDDVARLQSEDPFRFQAWQVQQMKLQAANVELERSRNEKSQAAQTEWTNHVQKENELAIEFIPELADKVKGPALTQRAADRLGELGFKPEELNELASGKQKLSIYDHRIQRLIFSDLKLSDIQKAKIVAVAKPAPPVQRPGTSKPPGSAVSDTIQNLSAKLERSGNTRDLGALIGAMRRA